MPDTDSTFKSMREEAREILERMPLGEFEEKIVEIGKVVVKDPGENHEDWKQRAIDYLFQVWDNKPQVCMKVCRVLGILKDEDRKLKMIGEQLNLTRRATEASEQSAKDRWVAIGISGFAILISCLALWRSW